MIAIEMEFCFILEWVWEYEKVAKEERVKQFRHVRQTEIRKKGKFRIRFIFMIFVYDNLLIKLVRNVYFLDCVRFEYFFFSFRYNFDSILAFLLLTVIHITRPLKDIYSLKRYSPKNSQNWKEATISIGRQYIVPVTLTLEIIWMQQIYQNLCVTKLNDVNKFLSDSITNIQ